MSNKKNRYVEPEMPESLRKFLSDDISPELDDMYRSTSGGSQRPKKRPPGSAKKGSPQSNKRPKKSAKRPAPSNRPVKAQPAKKSSKRPAQKKAVRMDQETKRIPVVKTQKKRPAPKRPAPPVDERTKRIPIPEGKAPAKKAVKKTGRPAKAVKPAKAKKARRKKKKIKFSNIIPVIAYGVMLFFRFVFKGGDTSKYVNKKKREALDFKFYRAFSLGAMAILTVFMVIMLVKPSQDMSKAENRELQKRPKFSVHNILNGSYSKEYSKYISDQFPARSSFIKRKANFDRFLGKKEINGVYICKDGYLMEGFEPASKEVTEAKAKAINKFVGQNPKLNVSMMIVPNKVEIYKGLLPKNAPVGSQAKYLEELQGMMDKRVRFLNLTDTFNSVKNSTQLYFKTDHHWTPEGAYKGYEYYMNKLGINPIPENKFKVSLATDKFLGSLYYKNGAQIGEPEKMNLYLKDEVYPLLVKYYDTKKKTTTLFDPDKLDGRDPYEVFTGGNHTQIKIRTAVDTDKKLLVIKDSYANAMLPLLINNYAEINVVDMRYYTGKISDILNNNEITDVLILYNVNTFNTDASILSIGDSDEHQSQPESGQTKNEKDTNKTSDKKDGTAKKAVKKENKKQN